MISLVLCRDPARIVPHGDMRTELVIVEWAIEFLLDSCLGSQSLIKLATVVLLARDVRGLIGPPYQTECGWTEGGRGLRSCLWREGGLRKPRNRAWLTCISTTVLSFDRQFIRNGYAINTALKKITKLQTFYLPQSKDLFPFTFYQR